MARFTPFFPQLFALHFSTSLNLQHPSLNQSSLTPFPLTSSRSCLAVFTFSCHSLLDLKQLLIRYHYPSSAHVCTIQLHSLLLTHLQFPSTSACPSVLQTSFCLPFSDCTWLSSLLSPFSIKLRFHFLFNTISRFHTVLLILCNNDKLYFSSSKETYFQVAALHIS